MIPWRSMPTAFARELRKMDAKAARQGLVGRAREAPDSAPTFAHKGGLLSLSSSLYVRGLCALVVGPAGQP